MKILILGGTQFVGRSIAEKALANGHDLTMFNRGKTNPHLFPDVEKRIGDRDDNLVSLQAGSWDVVIDVNGYVPRHVRNTAELLKDRVKQYIYISTGAVYATPFKTNSDENAPVKILADESSEDVDTYYGELKLLCERAAEEIMPGRVMVQRLGLVAGAYDDTDRVTYWVKRIAEGGEVLAPGNPQHAIQVVDARDIADFCLFAAEQNITGIFNTTGQSMSWKMWFDIFKAVGNSDAHYTWIDDRAFLKEHLPRKPYGALPLFLPESWGDWWTANSDKAQSLGLTYRPMQETARQILEWIATLPSDKTWLAGLTPDEERQILVAYQQGKIA